MPAMSYVLLSLTPNHISRFPFRRTTSSKQQYACIIALLFTFGFACVAAAQAHKVTVLHTFESIPDGASPYLGSLIKDAEGNLYGTAQMGGDYDCRTGEPEFPGCGVVFKLDSRCVGQSLRYHPIWGRSQLRRVGGGRLWHGVQAE